MTTNRIHVSAVVLRDASGRVLTVRKRRTSRFMLPGGKPEPGEDPSATAVREVAEELGVAVDPARLRLLGTFTAPAANEVDHEVVATVYEHPPVEVHTPSGEIAEIRWFEVKSVDTALLAPLLSDAVFPQLVGG
ncbi:NUDIX hydrolase [Williamsia sterculiae]|uniref:ADP-ribose pyrophosphatase YjhB, NUDIX family n=1 Tax=Williamsia sterculiae TaxID=1344003 RepID=A0A1N7H285_9NOCA|nr:NUDIX domain-containing protein [Williamsia sterculiae]SIS18944.1 ADP-ribose pyrophosphatase YjhB, NUDIX family [Williamsia sterculiae]